LALRLKPALYKRVSIAAVVKLVDTPDLGSGDASRGGSSPSSRTILYFYDSVIWLFFLAFFLFPISFCFLYLCVQE
jgi:hypothetical protein